MFGDMMLPHDPTIKAILKRIEFLERQVKCLKQKYHNADIPEMHLKLGMDA